MALPAERRRLMILFVAVAGKTGIPFRNFPCMSCVAVCAGSGGVGRFGVQLLEGAVAGTAIL